MQFLILYRLLMQETKLASQNVEGFHHMCDIKFKCKKTHVVTCTYRYLSCPAIWQQMQIKTTQ